jgi:seryl-tRNA synthetase
MAEEKKRTVLTPEQRVARLEAQLAEAKAKAEAKNAKQIDVLLERGKKISERIAKLDNQYDEITRQLAALGYDVNKLNQPELYDVNDDSAAV